MGVRVRYWMIGCGLSVTTLFGAGLPSVDEAVDIAHVFPATIEEIDEREKEVISYYDERIEELLQAELTFDSLARLYDEAFGTVAFSSELIETVAYVNPDSLVRHRAAKACAELEKHIQYSPEILRLFLALDSSKLSEEQRYFLESTIAMFKANGALLSPDRREAATALEKEEIDLAEQFHTNIQEGGGTFTLSHEELGGMDEQYIESLKQNEDGAYTITTEYPTILPLLSSCRVEQSRKKAYKAFCSRAYPKNDQVLKDLSRVRNERALLLGYDSYADMQLSLEMCKSSARATEFLDRLNKELSPKVQEELALIRNNLPGDVALTPDGRLKPWDERYVQRHIKKELFDVDEESLKVYYPIDKTIEGLMNVYSLFFDITVEEVEAPALWHPDLRVVQVSKQEKVLGFVVLDLYPRNGKYTHACHGHVLPTVADSKSLGVLICNFPKSDGLLRPSDVRTFFHEFGHALHAIFGRTDYMLTSGTNTKLDFVELPSQMLEQWLFDPNVLALCTSHYKTGEPLPLETIEKVQRAKTAFSGMHYARQVMLAKYSLAIYQTQVTDPKSLWVEYAMEYRKGIAPSRLDHGYLSFGHLAGYGACYYGYLYSNVFAMDIFEKIEKEGLLNPEMGELYRKTIIGPGGSLDPNRLLENFLGREPSYNAFIRSI